ncbi:MAG TPA: WecB/TagA/CpsF family glycosyltransferase, partial [Candidatus Saccharimonadales bacterium]|nr:WecB/TagA/CpsF family glycosyltransferase [Candidatus Saccharimonadales bacterium]
MLVKNYILGIGFNNLSKGEILEYIENSIRKKEKKYYIVTPNPELLVIAHKDSEYKKVLNGAKLASADGIGIMWAAKILRKSVRERLTGVDLVENLCKHIAEKPITVGFLGGGAGVAEKTAECLIKRYPKLNIVFAAQEWESGELGAEVGHKNFLVHDAKKVNLSMQQSSASANRENSESSPRLIDILFVAFGSPKQELW